MTKRKDFYWLNDDSRLFLSRGYLLENQTAEQRLTDIANEAENILGIKGFADKFHGYLAKGYYSLSTPVWTNFGIKDRGLPISCYGQTIQDDIGDILFSASEVGIMSKLGGGTSGYFGNLRPRGASIKNNGESSGAVHFMKLFEQMTDTISQGSSRRGRYAPYLPIDHPDAMEFLDIGTEGNDIQDVNHGVTVSDSWMIQMIGGDADKRELWAKVLKSRVEIGYPYIFFTDAVNNNKPEWYKDYPITHSNLCVHGDTRILTKSGYQDIKSLAGEKSDVWNGEEWSEVDVVQTGESQKLLHVKTDSGYDIKTTPYHKFYVLEWTESGKRTKPPRYKEVRAGELSPGDCLIKFNLPAIDGDKELELAYDNGFYSGDGATYANGGVRLDLYGDKKELLNFLPSVDTWSNIRISDTETRLSGKARGLKEKYFVPSSGYSIDSKLLWLSGYLDADGTVTNNNGSQSLQAASINKGFLQEVQLMLQTLGVDSKVTVNKEAGATMLPKNDGTGDYAEYQTKEIYRILINGNSLFALDQLGLKCNRLIWTVREPNRKASHFIRVESIEEVNGLHDTFCFTEPKRNMGMFNGLLTGNCSEIALPDNEDWSFVCNLSSMNALHYNEWKDTDAVETMIYFLDAVMTEFIEKLERYRDSEDLANKQIFMFMEKSYNFAKDNRALGLGLLGLHSLFQSKMLPFESVEASLLNEQIFKTIKERSTVATKELAKMFGEPLVMKGTGRRNATLAAVAPTTSSAFILGQVSQSIEPIWSNNYIKDIAKAKIEIKNQYLEEVLERYGKNTRDVWIDIRNHDGSVQHLEFLTDNEREVFKTFSEINQYEVINQASVRQKYIDQSQSLNVMVNPSTSTKDINALHIYAWENDIKTLYYQHSTNAAQALYRSSVCLACEA